MKIATKLSMLFVSSLMLLAAFSPALALASTTMAPEMTSLSTSTGSYNWGGYAVTGTTGSVTSVSGSWTVPTTTASANLGLNPTFGLASPSLASAFSSTFASRPDPISRPSAVYYAAFWVGIDGFNSQTVEQTGILAESTSTATTYFAWYEFYPYESVIEITTASTSTGTSTPATVKSGDAISASVTYSAGTFTLTISDTTEGWTYSKTGSQSGAQESSAEWIVETPEVNGRLASLADFGTVTFSGCDATIAPSTTSEPIGTFSSSSSCYAITIYNYPRANTVMASPSSIGTSSTSFSVTWKSAGP